MKQIASMSLFIKDAKKSKFILEEDDTNFISMHRAQPNKLIRKSCEQPEKSKLILTNISPEKAQGLQVIHTCNKIQIYKML